MVTVNVIQISSGLLVFGFLQEVAEITGKHGRWLFIWIPDREVYVFMGN